MDKICGGCKHFDGDFCTNIIKDGKVYCVGKETIDTCDKWKDNNSKDGGLDE